MMFIPLLPPILHTPSSLPVTAIVSRTEVFLEEKVPLIVEQQGSILMPKGVINSINKPPSTLTNIDGTTNFVSGLFPNQSAPSTSDKSNQRGNSTPRPVVTIGTVGRQDFHSGGNGTKFSAWG